MGRSNFRTIVYRKFNKEWKNFWESTNFIAIQFKRRVLEGVIESAKPKVLPALNLRLAYHQSNLREQTLHLSAVNIKVKDFRL